MSTSVLICALRNPQAREMVDFAQALFDETDGVVPVGDRHFAELWAASSRLNGSSS